MTTNKTKPKRAWYYRFREEIMKAGAYISVFNHWLDRPEEETYRDFEKLTLTRFVFESNNFEKEGLPRAATRELIIKDFEKFPYLEDMFLENLKVKIGVVFDKKKLEKYLEDDKEDFEIQN